MTDLLKSLVLPSSSQESFHSLAERFSSSSPAPDTANHDSATSQSPPLSQPSALQAAGLPIYDVDAFLAAPENATLLHHASDRKNAPTQQRKPEINPSQPVSLGSRSTHHVTALNTLCQQKGLVPDFQIDGSASNADFGGFLKIGDVVIARDERWHNKKEAREALAERGLETVKSMEAQKKIPKTPSVKDKNWIGLLHGQSPVLTKLKARLSVLTIYARVPQFHQPTGRTNIPRLLARILIQFYMYHPLSPRPILWFLSGAVPVKESSSCEFR